jgi:hypothetical protein
MQDKIKREWYKVKYVQLGNKFSISAKAEGKKNS